MDFFINNIGTVILVPLWVFVIILFGKLFAVMQSKRFMSGLTYLSTLYGLIFSIFVFAQTTITKGFTFEHIVPFITLSDVRFNIGVYVDGLSAWMLLVVFLISLLVQIYSYFYMQNDKSFMRYFAYMNLFTFSMSGLILAPNMFQTYVFWELVGISSYLLIGFWYKKNSAQIASKKAFIHSCRIACQQISNMGKEKRLIFSYIPENYVLGNSCNFISCLSNEYGVDIYYLLGLMNCSVMNWFFKLKSSNNHVNNYEIDEFPIPLFPKRTISKISKPTGLLSLLRTFVYAST